MQIVGSRYLSGPNLAGDSPGLSIMIARAEGSAWLENALPTDFAARRDALANHLGGYAQRVLLATGQPSSGEGETLRLVLALGAQVLAPVTAASQVGRVLGAGKSRITIFLPCESAQQGLAALACAVELAHTLLCVRAPDQKKLRGALAELTRASLEPRALAQAREALARNIPWHRDTETGALRFGQGSRISASLSEGDPGRVPTVGITGSVGKTTTAQVVAHVLRAAGLTPGLGSTCGMWIGEEQVSDSEFYQQVNGAKILHDPRADALVLEMPRGGLFTAGAAVDQLDVGVVLNVLPNHLGANGFNTLDDIARTKAIVPRIARKGLVLNAEDPAALAMRGASRAEQIALFALDAANVDVVRHAGDGGLCAVREDERLCVRLGDRELYSLAQTSIPAMRAMPLDTFAASALAASLSATILGIAPDAIDEALRTFESDFRQNPGRNNRVGGLPFELILTMSDGPPGFGDLVRNLPQVHGGGPSMVCLTAAGDRPDEWIVATGEAIAGHFDRYLLFDWPDRRGREPLEVPDLLMQGIGTAPGASDRVTILDGEDHVEKALSLVPPNGRLVLSYASTGGAIDAIRRFANRHGYRLEL